MSAPLALTGMGEMLVALAIGTAFGAVLERSGLGSARKLMGQFTLKDLAVFKVMFTAIVTAMLGVFWLSRMGWLDLSRVYVPETFIVPQLAGGVIFGVGFAIAGLCPGTSCVAAATGRLDGLATMGGMLTGVLVIGLALPRMQSFYESTARGAFTLSALTGLPNGLIVFGITALALAGFSGAARVERWSASRANEAQP